MSVLLCYFRAYVLREMFGDSDQLPERHDLTLFPTVNDLKNHLHQAFRDIENGTLGVSAATVLLSHLCHICWCSFIGLMVQPIQEKAKINAI